MRPPLLRWRRPSPSTSPPPPTSPRCSSLPPCADHNGPPRQIRRVGRHGQGRRLCPVRSPAQASLAGRRCARLGLARVSSHHLPLHRVLRMVSTPVPVPVSSGLYYYEVKVINKGRSGYVSAFLSRCLPHPIGRPPRCADTRMRCLSLRLAAATDTLALGSLRARRRITGFLVRAAPAFFQPVLALCPRQAPRFFNAPPPPLPPLPPPRPCTCRLGQDVVRLPRRRWQLLLLDRDRDAIWADLYHGRHHWLRHQLFRPIHLLHKERPQPR